MDDLITTIQQKILDLNHNCDQLARRGADYAKAERDYRVLLRTEALKMKAEGCAVGLINMTVYGIEEVAGARLQRDIAEANYKATQERINAIKLEIRILDSQIAREWGRNE